MMHDIANEITVAMGGFSLPYWKLLLKPTDVIFTHEKRQAAPVSSISFYTISVFGNNI